VPQVTAFRIPGNVDRENDVLEDDEVI